MLRRFAAICILLAGLGPAGALGQSPEGPLDTGLTDSPILVIDFDRVFAQSAFGQRLEDTLESEGSAIAAENRRIEAELIEEERRLTDQRPTMPPAEFRSLADAFDEKVQRLRSEQDAKARALSARQDEARRRFLNLAEPAIEQLMRETGAVMILERRAVFVAADAVDATDRAIALLDQVVGDGGSDVLPDLPEGALPDADPAGGSVPEAPATGD
ncbi:OmpH family outer membrane protein [Ponticoccus alexandrii]|uniref:OmpH family outer membrane protein n=1 Tax=Ponticoccus alexandrii TaxID=1943633 RepID=A0ABX7FAL5_9RHOB|nr:OmpH family outer membrane protein [Ponticoccus alexandrii]QRF66594.1 OmpH family outer membrane protein [Ponticoccus alexandrii]